MQRITLGTLDETQAVAIDVPYHLLDDFRQLVQRGTNLWPDAPAHIKHFADIITNGKPMQDYFANPNLAGTVKANPADKDLAQKSLVSPASPG